MVYALASAPRIRSKLPAPGPTRISDPSVMTSPSSTEQTGTQASGWKLAGFALLFILLSAGGTWAIWHQFADNSFSFDDRLLSAPFLIAAVVLLGIYFAADGLRLHFTLRALGHSLPIGQIFRLVFINIFFSNVTPMATGGGFAQIWYLQRKGVPVGTATAATTIRTVLAIAFIFSVTPICLLWLDALEGQPLLGEVSGLLALFIALYLGFFAIVLLKTRWLIAPLSTLIDLLHRIHVINEPRRRRWQFGMKREMVRFARSFAIYIRGPRRDVLLSVVFTLVFLISLFSFPALLMTALGYDVDYLTVIGLLFVTTFIMYFAPTPGASGISEGVFGSFFSTLVSANHLVLVTVAWRFLTIYLGMIIGLVLMQRELASSLRTSQVESGQRNQTGKSGSGMTDDPTQTS